MRQELPDVYDGLLEPTMTLCIESDVGGDGESEGVKREEQMLIAEDGHEPLAHFPFEESLLGCAL